MKIFPILLSNLLVAGVVWFFASSADDASADALAAKDKEILALKDELSKRSARPPARETRFARNENVPAAASPEEATVREVRRAERRARQTQFQKAHAEASITRLGLRLNLTDEQKTKLAGQAEKREMLGAQMGDLFETMRKARENGEDTSALEAQIGVLRDQLRETDLERYVAEILSEEQQPQYQEYMQERATERAEASATMRLLRLQQAVSLTPEQKDKYFSATASAILNSETPISPQTENEILKNILTNEQYSAYEAQAEAFRRMMPGRPRAGEQSPP